MVEHICKRCNYRSIYRSCLRNHLNRKNPCNPTIADLSRELLLEEIPVLIPVLNEITYNCNKCNRKFNDNSNRSKHQKTCTINPEVTKINLMQKEINQMKQEMADLKTHQIIPTVLTNTSINQQQINNITNNNINIILNVYHKGDPEKYDSSTIDFNNIFNKIVGDNTNGIIPFLKMKYFNPDHPENHIIRINDKKLMDSGSVYVHNGTTWDLESSTKVYNELNNEAANSLLDNMNSGKSISRKHIPDEKFNGIYNGLWIRDPKKPKDQVIDELNNLLVNNINEKIMISE